LVADGDSITAGFGVATPYTGLLALTGVWDTVNLGVNSETLATMRANAPTNVDPRFRPLASANVVVIWGGTNDITEGQSPATVYANMVLYVSGRHAKGFKVIVPTMLSRQSWDTQKNALNTLILANSADADGIVDFTGTVLGCDGCWANPANFLDGTHPTQPSVTNIIAPKIGTAVNVIPHVLN
jgi:hypothetical protein